MWAELLSVLLFAMGWWPCGGCWSGPFPPPPPPGPWPWPPGDPDCDCTHCVDEAGHLYDGCDPCPTITLLFRSHPDTGDPLECPCDELVVLDACLYSDAGEDVWMIGFNLATDAGCADVAYRVKVKYDGADLTATVDGKSMSKAVGTWDCTSITWSDTDETHEIGANGMCQWYGFTVAYGSCT